MTKQYVTPYCELPTTLVWNWEYVTNGPILFSIDCSSEMILSWLKTFNIDCGGEDEIRDAGASSLRAVEPCDSAAGSRTEHGLDAKGRSWTSHQG